LGIEGRRMSDIGEHYFALALIILAGIAFEIGGAYL
jgi:hypothetical protein